MGLERSAFVVNVPAMKSIWGALSCVSLFFSACARDFATDTSTTATPVAGEQTGDSSMSPTAGPGGAGANVRW